MIPVICVSLYLPVGGGCLVSVNPNPKSQDLVKAGLIYTRLGMTHDDPASSLLYRESALSLGRGAQ